MFKSLSVILGIAFQLANAQYNPEKEQNIFIKEA
jgi:hypothetical protein